VNESEKRRKRVSVLLQLFCNSAQMSSSALKERRNSLGERIAIIRMFIKTQTNSMCPSCRLTRTVLSLSPFFSLSLFYVTRIVSDEFRVNDYVSLSWNRRRCCFCRLAILRRLADRQKRSLHGNHSVLRTTGVAATFFPSAFPAFPRLSHAPHDATI